MKIRQILESVSVGGMGTGSIATVSAPLGKVQRRVKKEDAAGVGIVTKQNATADVPVGGEYMNVKKFFPNKKKEGVAEGSLEEITQDTARSYAQKATQSKKDLINQTYRKGADTDKLNKKIQTRQQGLNRAHTDKRYYKDEQGVAEGSEYKSRHAHKQEQDKAYNDYRTKHATSSLALMTRAEFAKDQRERAAKKKQGVAEVSLGSYLNKASMSRGQAQMGAMFGTDPEQKAKDLATFQKRDKGIERAKPRAEKARKDAAEKARTDQLAADKANLPELIAQYQKLRNQYDPDFEYSDDHSFWRKQKDIQQSMHSLQQRINQAGGSLEENKKGVRAVKHTVKPRNFVAKNAAATTSGAGAHKDKKKAMKQGEVKHKGKEPAYESKLWAALERKVNR